VFLDVDAGSFMGGGMAWTIILLALCIFLPFRKKKEKTN